MAISHHIAALNKKAPPFFKLFLVLYAFLFLSILFLFSIRPAKENKAIELPEVSFNDQMGNEVTQDLFAKNNTITAFFFTLCPTICPKMVSQMKQVQSLTNGFDKYSIFFITIDPTRDSTERLKKFAKKNAIDERNWQLLTGDEEAVRKMSHYFQVRAGRDKNDTNSFVHDGSLIFMNRAGETYYYDGTDTGSVELLLARIAKEN